MRDKHSYFLLGVCCFVLLEIDPIALMVWLVGTMDPGGEGHSLQQTCTLISHTISSISCNICTHSADTLPVCTNRCLVCGDSWGSCGESGSAWT